MTETVSCIAHRARNTLGSYPLNLIFLIVLKGANQVDTLLDGANGCDFVVDFHGAMRSSLVCVLACEVVDGTVEEFSLRFVHLVVCSTVKNNEVVLPASSHPVVLFGRGKCT